MHFAAFVRRSNSAQIYECTTLPASRRRTTQLAGTAFTGAFLAAIVGYPQGALAACLGENTGNVTCDAGSQATAGALVTDFAGTTVVNNNVGGKIDTGGAYVNVSAAGTLTFNHNDTAFGITNTAGSGVTLFNDGAITYSGNAVVTATGSHALALGSFGGAGNITITSNATVQSTTDAGMLVSKVAGSGAVLVNGSGAATGATYGISVDHDGTDGGITSSGSGGTTGTAAVGIYTYISNPTNASNIQIDRSGNVTGADGIVIYHFGTGNITVTGGSLVSGTGGSGISALQFNSAAGTDGSVTVGGAGDVNAVGGVGIFAEVSFTSNTGNVTVTRSGTVIATGTGIQAAALGGGNVNVTGTGNVNSSGDGGISAIAFGGNGNVMVAPAGTVSAVTFGIFAASSGSGNVTVTTSHDVTGSQAGGIVASVEDGRVTVNVAAGTVSGSAAGFPVPGIQAIATGTGGATINVSAGASVIGEQSDGVGVVVTGTNNIIVNNGTIRGAVGIVATGSTTIVNAGAIIGTIGPAVLFVGANNTLIMQGASATLAGQIIGSGTDTFRLAGTGPNSFDVGQIGTGWTLLDKSGASHWTLTGTSTYAGPVTVNGGTLSINGDLTSAASLTVNAGGTLAGTGTVGSIIINGGTLSPGTLNVAGNLVFTAAASYMVEVSPASADRTNVRGTATIAGATVKANFAAGTFLAKQYTILNATGGLYGTFSSVVNTNLPGGFTSSLSYDANNAFLNMALVFVPPPGGFTINQQNVGNAIVNFFNSTGSIPIVFGGLTPAGLTQISGETAIGSQQTTFNAMNQFMGVMTDPFIAGRDNPVSGGGNPNAYAEESLTYAAKRKPDDALAAIYTKAPPIAPLFEQRWSTWAAGYGGSLRTDGDPRVLGSNDTRSSIYGSAVGADYRLSPNTLAGFALAGGGTNFSVNGFGGGRSDLFQAGAFIRHNFGAAYVSGALAYGWQDITTDRTVTVAGIDRLRAQFNANAWSGRVEGGYRFVSQGFGWTPYAAGQFTTFELPNYAEQAIVGANTFALAYTSSSVTDTRSELGLRTDKSFAVQNGILTLRGRAAWAHDYNADRNAVATFQALPGASFVVNGARQAADAALVTGSAEMKWVNGWSIAGTFEGEFSDVTRSYTGKGVLRYAW